MCNYMKKKKKKIFYTIICERNGVAKKMRGPLNALVLLPFILFRNIQRHRTRYLHTWRITCSNQDSLIHIRIIVGVCAREYWTTRVKRDRHKF